MIGHADKVDNGNCPTGWMNFGDACFYKSMERVEWAEAEAKCYAAGGLDSHLASCLTEAEMGFLVSKCQERTDYWIGIHDRSVEIAWSVVTVLAQ